jgi:cell division protein ZapB
MADSQLRTLEQKIDELIKLCGELNRENVSLKTAARDWATERQELIARHDVARRKVQEMLGRLKAVEQTK